MNDTESGNLELKDLEVKTNTLRPNERINLGIPQNQASDSRFKVGVTAGNISMSQY